MAPNEPPPPSDSDDDGPYISDDSSFYGDATLKSILNARATAFDSSTYWPTHSTQLSVIQYLARLPPSQPPQLPNKPFNPYSNQPTNARQLSEPVSAFLTRLPPLTTLSSTAGPWLYIANPHSPFRDTSAHLAAFKHEGLALLSSFSAHKAALETALPALTPSSITKTLTPLREQLRTDLLACMRRHNVVTGKWMLFTPPARVNAVWAAVAEGTANGELGCAAKVATEGGEGGGRLVCVYTEDWGDGRGVRRVLEGLVGLGVVQGVGGGRKRKRGGGGGGIYYKCDGFTYLDVMGGNEWGLRASMFSSREILEGGGEGG